MHIMRNFDSDNIDKLLKKLNVINEDEEKHVKDILTKASNEINENKYVGTINIYDGRYGVYVHSERILVVQLPYTPIRYKLSES